eukprot:GFYU01002942.1.p1 GENE.GFYU01002942.1~~GFYU01002942.1.p1  ORF type:complete len:1058 (-),score=276.22 GFYU01002942.1:150-3323(-)
MSSPEDDLFEAFLEDDAEVHEDLVTAALEDGADVNAVSNLHERYKRFAPLHWAALTGAVGTAKLLVDQGADINGIAADPMGFPNTPLHVAVDARTDQNTLANKYGEVDILARYLVRMGADVNKPDRDGHFLIFKALELKDDALTALILDHGGDDGVQNKKGDTAKDVVKQMAQEGSLPYVQVLLDIRSKAKWANEICDPSTGRTLLHWVGEHGMPGLVHELCSVYGADPNFADKDGLTPLHYAADHGRDRAMKALLDHKAHPGVEDNKGRIASEIAMDNDNYKCVELLSEYAKRQHFPTVKYTYQGLHSAVLAIAHDTQLNVVISGGVENILLVSDMQNPSVTKKFYGHGGNITSVCCNGRPDGVFSGSTDQTVRQWDLNTVQVVHTYKGHEGGVKCVKEFYDYLFSSSLDGTVRCWSIKSKQETHKFVAPTHEEGLTAIQIYNGALIAGSTHNTVHIWSLASHQLLDSFAFCNPGPNGLDVTVTCLMATTRIDGGNKVLLIGTDDGHVYVYSLEDCEGGVKRASEAPSHKIPTAVPHAFDEYSGQLFVAFKSVFKRINLRNGTIEKSLRSGHGRPMTAFKICDGHAYTGAGDGAVKAVTLHGQLGKSQSDLSSSVAQLQQLKPPSRAVRPSALATPKQPESTCIAMEFDWLALGMEDGGICIWNSENFNGRAKRVKGHPQHVTCMTIEGNYLFSGSEDGIVNMWNLETYKLLTALEKHTKPIRVLIVSGGILVSGSGDKTVCKWDIKAALKKKDALLFQSNCSFSGISAALLSEEYIFAGCRDGYIQQLDIKTGKCLREYHGHKQCITHMALADGDRVLVSASEDGTIKSWDAVLRDFKDSGETFSPCDIADLMSGMRDIFVAADDHKGGELSMDQYVKLTRKTSEKNVAKAQFKRMDTQRRGVLDWHAFIIHSDRKALLHGNSEDQSVYLGLPLFTYAVGDFVDVRFLFVEGDKIIAGHADGTLRVYPLRSQKMLQELKQCSASLFDVTNKHHVTFSHSGQVLVWEGKFNQVEAVNLADHFEFVPGENWSVRKISGNSVADFDCVPGTGYFLTLP